jgi:hypothetical protein
MTATENRDFFQQLSIQHQTNIEHKHRTNLIRFFSGYKCPTPYYITDYLNAAQRYNLDYRLLPAISIAESTCGRFQLYNNWWGFWSDTKGFKDVPSGIDYVSDQLADGQPYAGKSIIQKMRSYNPNPSYAPKIIGLMKEIANE